MKRRLFIKGAITAATAVLINSTNAYSFLSKKKVRGKVASFGKGIKNVVVTNGYDVSLTDNKGNYELPFNNNAQFVYLSLPAGYEFPTENHLAKHYHFLNKSDSAYDFDLTRLKTDDDAHQFIVWADPQVKNKKDVGQMMETAVPDVQQLVKDLGENTLIHGITVGDIVWDNHDLIADYTEAVKRMGIPFFQALGNHDMDYRQGGDETSDRTFKLRYGPTYYSFNRGKAHYIVLDDVRYLGSERNYDGFLAPEQLLWLKKDLEHVPKDHLIIIGLHIPVHNSVKNREELYALLAGRKVHIMSGHTHYNNNYEKYGVYEHVHGTVCGAWWTGPLCGDGTPRGYGVYEVKGNELSWYYKSTGKSKDYQFSIHVEELTNQKRLMVNVWNWDSEWKTEWWANGKYMGNMEPAKGFDPLTVKLYKGDKLPQGRTFAEPKRTDHLFMAHVNPEINSIKIKVTDRFGKVYHTEQKI
jgi:hypothetical protein